jgi:organic hydroperoxide reductase OsmC/OhrA
MTDHHDVTVAQQCQELRDMTRPELVDFLQTVECTFPLDFTDDFLATTSTPQLLHIAVAACFHTRDSYVAEQPACV